MDKALNKNSFFIFSLLILFVISFVLYYVVSLVYMIFVSKISSLFEYRIGYILLLIGLSSLTLLLGDLFLFIYVFRVFVFKKYFQKSLLKIFLKSFFSSSLPIILILVPYIVVGLGGVFNEELFYHPAAIIIYVYSVSLGFYGLFVHPIYAPYAALAVNRSLEASDDSFIATYRYMRRDINLLPNILATSIVVWIITTLLTAALIYLIPFLSNTLIPVPRIPQDLLWSWRGRWYEALNNMMPKYYNLIAGPLQYLFYAYIFRKISMRKLFR